MEDEKIPAFDQEHEHALVLEHDAYARNCYCKHAFLRFASAEDRREAEKWFRGEEGGSCLSKQGPYRRRTKSVNLEGKIVREHKLKVEQATKLPYLLKGNSESGVTSGDRITSTHESKGKKAPKAWKVKNPDSNTSSGSSTTTSTSIKPKVKPIEGRPLPPGKFNASGAMPTISETSANFAFAAAANQIVPTRPTDSYMSSRTTLKLANLPKRYLNQHQLIRKRLETTLGPLIAPSMDFVVVFEEYPPSGHLFALVNFATPQEAKSAMGVLMNHKLNANFAASEKQGLDKLFSYYQSKFWDKQIDSTAFEGAQVKLAGGDGPGEWCTLGEYLIELQKGEAPVFDDSRKFTGSDSLQTAPDLEDLVFDDSSRNFTGSELQTEAAAQPLSLTYESETHSKSGPPGFEELSVGQRYRFENRVYAHV